MNTKRQTIWLISMLSLMVVLSAYYLFTSDIDDPDLTADTSQTGQNDSEAANDGMVITDVSKDSGYTLSAADEDILKKLDAEGFANTGLFEELLSVRDANARELNDRAMAAIAQTSSAPEEAAAALNELDQLEARYEKLRGLEEEFKATFDMALIDERDDRYKVVVTSEKLEKKQAAAIINRVIEELGVDADQVSVQFVQ